MSFLASTGWTVDALLKPASLAPTYFGATKLAGVTVDTDAFFAQCTVSEPTSQQKQT